MKSFLTSVDACVSLATVHDVIQTFQLFYHHNNGREIHRQNGKEKEKERQVLSNRDVDMVSENTVISALGCTKVPQLR
jgi:hypothetical protein